MSASRLFNFAAFKYAALTALTCLSAPSPTLAQTEDYARWSHFRGFGLTSPPSLKAPVANFPLLLRLDSTAADVFAGAKPGGADLRFRRVASRGDIVNLTDHQLSYQIAHWDSAARKAEIWVLMDTVKPTAGVDLSNFPHGLLMYWGKPDAPARSNAAAVFDTANGFVGVWHMGGSSPTAARANAVSGGNPAIPSGTSVATGFPLRAGAIGLADTLRGGTGSNATARNADDHFNLGSGYANFSGGATLSMWLKPATPPTTAWNVFMAFGNGAPGDNLTLGRMGNTQNLFGEVYEGTTGAGRTELNDAARYNEWQHVTFSVQGSQQALYHNGGQNGVTRTVEVTIPTVTRNMAYLGRSLWADPNAAMAIDEVRLHKVRRSADWVLLDYETQKPGSTSLQRYPAVSTPVLNAPANGATDAPFTTLSWENLSINIYRVQLSTDSLFLTPIYDSLVSNPSLPLGLLASGTYFWRVQGLELLPGTSAWSATRKFTVSPQPAEVVTPPVLVAPAASATGLTWNVPFSWKHADGATSYQLQVAATSDFAAPVREHSGITALNRTVSSGIDFNMTYYWRVRGWNAQGSGPWSETRSFMTAYGRPATPTLVSPAAYAVVPARSPTLSWSAVQAAVSYRVQVSLTSDFTTFVSNDTTTATSWTLGTLAGHTDYYWRVSAKNALAASAYSTARLFATSEPVALLPHLSGSLSVSAVRVGEETVLRLSLPRAERVTVRWRDLRGRLSAPLRDERLPAGSHSLRVPGGPTGVGILEIGIGASTRTLLIAP